MTNEQWLVYLWSIYPSGGYQMFYATFLIAYLLFIIYLRLLLIRTHQTDTKLILFGIKWENGR